MASEQTENSITGSAIPENEHKGEPETHGAISDIGAEGQRPGEGALSAGLGESGQDTTNEGQEGQGKSKEEEEIERTDREFSETIERLDSVLLEEAGGKEGQIEGDRADINATEQVRAKIEESGAKTTVHVPGGETTVHVSGGETTVHVPGGETTVHVPGGETTVHVPGGETTVHVPGGETIVHVPGGETTVHVPETTVHVPGGETTVQVPGGETTVHVPGGETTVHVPGGETTVHVPGGETTVHVPAEGSTVQVPAERSTVQIPVEGSTVQVPAEGTTVHVPGGETTMQVPGEGNAMQVPLEKGTGHVPVEEGTMHVLVTEAPIEAAEETAVPVSEDRSASQETFPQVTTEEDLSPQPVTGTDTGMHGIVTEASQAWIDTLVQNIVTEVTSEGTRADSQAHVSGESADSSSEPAEEGEHSCAGKTTIPEQVQVTSEETGAAVTGVQAQVPDITVQEGCEEVTHSPGQTGGLFSAERVSLIDPETAAEVEEGRQVKAPGQETHGEVTPDLMTVPDREGTADPGQPAACREKEWPPLMCTGSEVRADTAEQRHTEQETVHKREPCPGTPDMKDREILEDGVVLAPETPIEREIRLTMQREMTLRQERGISVPVGEPELVEVRRKTVVVNTEALSGKERQLAGAQMQREIQLETQREQDLVEQGKVMGTYDRGPQQELQEKKLIFESMNTEPSDPPLKRRQSELQKSASIEDEVDAPAPSNHVFSAAPPAAEVKKGPSYAEANGSNIIIIEHASILRKSAPGTVNSSAPAEVRRSSPAEVQRTSPAESRRSIPADLRYTRSSSGNSPLSESPVAAPGSPFQLLRSPSPRSLLEKEIEEVKERERELRKQRTSIYGRDNGTAENSQTAPNTDIQSGIYQPERPNWGKLEVNWPPNSGMTVNGQQDQAWDSPRTRRQRNALIQSWESGSPNPADDN